MRSLLGLVVVFAACSKAPGASSLLDRLPSGSSLVVGLTRAGSEEELGDALQKLNQSQGGAGIPPCVFEVFAKLEEAVAAVDVPPAPFRVSFALRGAGLRPAVEACFKAQVPGAQIEKDGAVTRYTIKNQTIHLLWLDDATVVGGPTSDSGATAALATVAAPLGKDAALQGLLGKVDRRSDVWFVADLTGLAATMPAGMPRPRGAWGQLAAASRVTVEMGSDADAQALAEQVRGLLVQAPEFAAAAAAKVVVSSDGPRLLVTAPLRDILAHLGGGADIPPAATTFAGIGVVLSVAIPAFLKNARKAKSAEAVVNVRKLFTSAQLYQVEHHELPPSAPITPPLGTCCKNENGTCAPDPALWKVEGWSDLGFAMEDPYRYSYQVTSTDDGFTVSAFGDLNCDGVYSTFEMAGKIGKDGELEPPEGMFRDKELE